jgi:curli biogenesis system outer membrane secretion channel CsgG
VSSTVRALASELYTARELLVVLLIGSDEKNMSILTRHRTMEETMMNPLVRAATNTALCLFAGVLLAGCATESHQALVTSKTDSAGTPYSGPRSTLVVGKFDNRSSYLRGLFSDGVDRLGGQAKTILIGHLQETGRFNVVDRDNMDEIAREATIKGQEQKLKGADFAVTGDVVEFGRKETGDVQLFGILGSGKRQVAYSKVTLNVVNVLTSEVVFTVSGAGEYALSNREVVGFGGAAGYDSTLNGKVLDLAIREAINRLVEGLEQGKWSPTRDAK